MRNQHIAPRAVARQPRSSGGTSAPRSARGGPTTGLGRAQQPQARIGLQNNRPLPNRPTAGPAGAAPPSPYTPTPWDAAAEQKVSGAQRNYLAAGNNLDYQETGVKQAFGLDQGFNDYKANPYSRAALLEGEFQKANRGTTNSAGLQLYSGSTGNRLAANRSGYDRNRDALAKDYQSALQEISDKRLEASEKKGEAENEAEWERIGHAEEAPLDPSQSSVGGKKKQPKKQPKKKSGGAAVGNNKPAKKGKR